METIGLQNKRSIVLVPGKGHSVVINCSEDQWKEVTTFKGFCLAQDGAHAYTYMFEVFVLYVTMNALSLYSFFSQTRPDQV